MTYKYTKIAKNKSQYEGITFDYGTFVEAKYVQSKVTTYQGNKWIEALPVPPDQDEIYELNTFIPNVSSETKSKSQMTKLLEIQQLSDLRLPLTQDYALWTNIYAALCKSYATRTVYNPKPNSFSVDFQDEKVFTGGKLIGSEGSAVTGFNMIGQSGCGKTSALEIALNYYPKVIRHFNEDGSSDIQIPYVLVNCPPNSNFKVLYSDFGKQIDLYLGNTQPVIQQRIEKKNRNLGQMLKAVEQVIEEYKIGIIIFDEVQLMDFDSQKENSFNALLNIANSTKVALGVVGTPDSIGKMGVAEQIARRVGNKIDCEGYTANDGMFDSNFEIITNFQWFKKEIEVNNKIKQLIKDESRGIIAYIVLIWQMINMEYVSDGKKDNITYEYVEKVINNNFGLIRDALNGTYKTISQKEQANKIALEQTINTFQSIVDKAQTEQEVASVIENRATVNQKIRKKRIVQKIAEVVSDDYSIETIEHEYDKILKKSPNIEDSELVKKLNRNVVNGKTQRRYGGSKKTNTKIEFEDIDSSIKDSILDDPNHPIK